MTYTIEYTFTALADLKAFKIFERRRVMDEIDAQLRTEPAVETRNRKRLRANEIADWELRIGRFRVFYVIVAGRQAVSIEAIGYKVGSKLRIRGNRIDL